MKELQEELKTAKDAGLKELERIAGLDRRRQAAADGAHRGASAARDGAARACGEEEAQADAKRRARNLVADALQRVAASHAAETTVSLVEPSDDMKGRIIGREAQHPRSRT